MGFIMEMAGYLHLSDTRKNKKTFNSFQSTLQSVLGREEFYMRDHINNELDMGIPDSY